MTASGVAGAGGRDGTDAWGDGEPPPRALRAGPWTATLRGDSVEDVAHRGRVLLAAVRVVVRDHDWRTPRARVLDTRVDVRDEGGDEELRVALDVEHDDLGVRVRWRATLTARRRDLRFAVELLAEDAFRCNRWGLVVLHPADAAGTPVQVHHPDGGTERVVLPERIAPHQPARDVAGVTWTQDGAQVSLTLTGDVFEVEDQRNWTDASFKTYSRPLALPFPVPLSRGDTTAQSAELVVRERAAPPAAGGGPTRRVPLTATGHPLPELQLGACTAPGDLDGPAPWWSGPVLVELDATGRAWPGVLARARREAGDAPLDVRVSARRPDELDPVLAALRGPRAGPVARVAVFDVVGHVTTGPLWRRLLRDAGDPPLLGGTRAHFTELNRRHHDLPPDLPALTFSTTPQMHDTGRTQLLRSVAVQRLVAEQAVLLARGRPVHVGPVTLRSRFNAVATSRHRPDDADVRTAGGGAEHVPGATDPRQTGRGYAAWLVASHQALAVEGVATLTWAETRGPRGFGTVDGAPFPAAGTVQQLHELRGWTSLRAPLVAGRGVVAARRGDRVVVLASDLTGSGQELVVGGRVVRVPAWGTVRHEGRAGPGDGFPDVALG